MIAEADRTGTVRLRAARPTDIDGVASLIDGYAAQGIMLAKSRASIAIALPDFIVATDERDTLLACGALREYSPSVAEVASVAVVPEAHGRGLGTLIVRAVEHLAEVRGIDELFALTLAPPFFLAAGYTVVDRGLYPEKVRKDCRSCARRFSCAEVCVQRVLHHATRAVAA